MFKTIQLDNLGIDKKRFEEIQKTWNEAVLWQQPIDLNSSSPNWNYEDGYNASVTLTASATLSIRGAKLGAYGTIKIIQGGSGSYTLTLPSGSKVAGAGAGALTLSTAIGSIDIATFYYDGTNYFWTLSTDFT